MEKLEHIAYLIPNTDVTGEMDCFRMLPGHIVHAERMWLDDVSEEAEQKMVREELPRAIRYLKGVAPYKCAVFGCTSASAANGKAGMEQIEKLMSDELSEILERPVITSNQCVIDYIKSCPDAVRSSAPHAIPSLSSSIPPPIINSTVSSRK